MEITEETTFDDMMSHASEEIAKEVKKAPEQESELPAEPKDTAPEAKAALPAEKAPVEDKPVYTPNYKYSVKKQEKEFDDFLRTAIQSKEHEDRLRDLYTRAEALEEIKQSRERVESDYKGYRQNFDPILQMVYQADQAYQRGDVDTFLNSLKLNPEVLKNYFMRQEQVRMLSPEAQAEYNRIQQAERERYNYQQEAETYKAQLDAYKAEQMKRVQVAEIVDALEDENVAPVRDAFDAKFGPNAFRRELQRRGKIYFSETGEVIPAKQVANELASLYGVLVQQAPKEQIATTTLPTQPQHKPVIPSVKGSSASAVQKNYESFDEMEKAYKRGELR